MSVSACHNREGKLDFYKGFLIWSVVIGHCMNVLCYQQNLLHVVLRTFDLPMFMFISGFLLRGSMKRHPWKELLVNKMTGIVMPCVLWMTVSLLFGDPHLYYFLWAIVISTIVVGFSVKCFHQPWLAGGMMVVIAIGFHLIPWNIVNISFLFPFFLLGFYNKNISSVSRRTGFLTLGLFVLLLVFVWKPHYSIWITGGYVLPDIVRMTRIVLVRLVIGVTGIYAAMFLLGTAYDFCRQKTWMRHLEGIGKQTLAIYLLQHIVIEILLTRWIGHQDHGMLQTVHPLVVGYVMTPVLSVALLVLMYMLALLMQKSVYTKWMFGCKMSSTQLHHFCT